MLNNPFRGLRRREWALWLTSLAAVLISRLASDPDPITLAATLIGVTALIFIARGDVWGQILTVVFAILYSLASWRLRYYGEIITYLGMSAPIAAASVVTWLKNPYKGENQQNANEVKIRRLSPRGILGLSAVTAIVTLAFYFILKEINNANLIVSTISVTTSFAASALMMLRSSYYALAYAANDVVLIVLWLIAASRDISYLPMAVNFIAFLANDVYGFISWKTREKRQK